MKSSHCLSFVLAVATTAAVHAGTSREAAAETSKAATSLTAPQLVAKVDESDPWGLGGAEVSAKHANFIIAHPGCRADDVMRLVKLIQEKVWEKNEIHLETEVKIWA